MFLKSIQLKNVCHFQGEIQLGDFVQGINTIMAPNEAGKSSIIKALTRGLFDKYTCKDKEIKKLQPSGTELGPEVRVQFQVKGKKYQIEKGFIQNPYSKLSIFDSNDCKWNLMGESDKSDQLLFEILKSSAPKRGASQSSHWGMFQYLWTQQGEPIHWFHLDGKVGEEVRSKLVQLSIDPAVEKIVGHLHTIWTPQYTQTGQLKSGGSLKSLHEKARQYNEDLDRIEAQIQSSMVASTNYKDKKNKRNQIHSKVDKLSHELAQHLKNSQKAKTILSELKPLELELKQHQISLNQIQKKLSLNSQLKVDLQRLNELEKNLQSQIEKESQKQSEFTKLHKKYTKSIKHKRDEAHLLFQKIESANNFEKRKELQKSLNANQRKLDKLKSLEKQKNQLNTFLSTSPQFTEQDYATWTSLNEEQKRLEARLEASTHYLELTAQKDLEIQVNKNGQSVVKNLKNGETQSIRMEELTSIRVPELLNLSVVSKGKKMSEDEKLKHSVNLKMDNFLSSFQIRESDQFLSLYNKVMAITQESKQIQALMDSLIDDDVSIEHLKSKISNIESDIEKINTSKIPDDNLQGMDLFQDVLHEELKIEHNRHLDEVEKIDSLLEKNQTDLKRTEMRLSDLRQQLTHCLVSKENVNTKLKSYEGGVDLPLPKQQEELALQVVLAEARVKEKQSNLPRHFKELDQRIHSLEIQNTQLIKELKTIERELHILEGELNTHAFNGYYTRKAEIVEDLQRIQNDIEVLTKKITSARYLENLITDHKSRVVATVLKPLEDLLSKLFSQMSGLKNRQVCLRKDLSFDCVKDGHRTLDFDQLSQGAKEQLTLCFRLALALELSRDEPQCLILDDVLVNSDPERQSNILKVLEESAGRLQLIILTCQPDRYANVGKRIEFN